MSKMYRKNLILMSLFSTQVLASSTDTFRFDGKTYFTQNGELHVRERDQVSVFIVNQSVITVKPKSIFQGLQVSNYLYQNDFGEIFQLPVG